MMKNFRKERVVDVRFVVLNPKSFRIIKHHPNSLYHKWMTSNLSTSVKLKLFKLNYHSSNYLSLELILINDLSN